MSPNAIKQAANNPIQLDRPGPRLIDAALGGNGQLGILVKTRPDGIAIHFGHTGVWDIRHDDHLPETRHTFKWVFDFITNAYAEGKEFWIEQEFQDYIAELTVPHFKPYPCPFPCGGLFLNIDRRQTEILGWTIDISTGRIIVNVLHQERKIHVEIFCVENQNTCWVQTIDGDGRPTASPFVTIALTPDVEPPPALPVPETEETNRDKLLCFTQRLPAQEPPP